MVDSNREANPGSGVRPTRRALDDLAIGIPPVGVRLEGLSHELIVRAQNLPQADAAGGSERILALDDRVWLKIKAETWRGAGIVAVPPLLDGQGEGDSIETWWIGAAGNRQGDTSQKDFYDLLTAECLRRRVEKNREGGPPTTKRASTDHLLPQLWTRADLMPIWLSRPRRPGNASSVRWPPSR